MEYKLFYGVVDTKTEELSVTGRGVKLWERKSAATRSMRENSSFYRDGKLPTNKEVRTFVAVPLDYYEDLENTKMMYES